MPLKRTRRHSPYLCVDLRKVRLLLDGKPVLRDIDWSLRPGQRWVLIGPNGAGKTQLLKLLAGDVWPTPTRGSYRTYRSGGQRFLDPNGVKDEIAYVGAERQDRYEHYAWNFRVESIVGTGLYRTDIPLDPLSGHDRIAIERLLCRLKIETLARRRFLHLSYGERRLVLLARALASRPKLLLLDEIFNGLDTINRSRVQECLRQLSRRSLPWVLSTHRLEDIPPEATHVCRLDEGRVTSQRRQRSSGRRRWARTGGSHQPIGAGTVVTPQTGEALVVLRRASVWREGSAVLRNVSLTVRCGECWVVHGANGSGKSSFLQLLYGDLGAAYGGTISRAGIESGVPLERFKRRAGLVAPELQALHPRYLHVDEVVASGRHASVGLNDPDDIPDSGGIRRALRLVGASGLINRTIRTLSYGQLRRVLFARALAYEPDMLLLDEPYAGVDVVTRKRLRALVARELSSGVTVVMVTHHRDEWPVGTSHELELRQSRVVYAGVLRQ